MRLSASDAAVTTLSVLLSALLVYLYMTGTGFAVIRNNSKPLGTIVFKEGDATRRVTGQLVWERMRNNSPVYGADTLRTGNASQAAIEFDDGTSIDMNQDSMVKLDFAQKQRLVRFLGGNISVSGPPSGSAGSAQSATKGASGRAAYAIAVADRTITVSQGAGASVTKTGDTLNVEVTSGQVGVRTGGGAVQTLDPTKELEIGLKSGTSRVIDLPIVPVSPAQDARMLLERIGDAEVSFSWTTTEKSGMTFELADNIDFSPVAVSHSVTGDSVSVKVAPGTWFWRLRATDGATSAVRRFVLYTEPPPRPIYPPDGTRVDFRQKPPEISFSWTGMPDANGYILEAASDLQFTKPVVRERTNLENVMVDSLTDGTWYWRVMPVYAMTLVGKEAVPEVRTVVIAHRTEMAPVGMTAPPAGSVFVLKDAAQGGVSFSWIPNQEAVAYELSISRSRDMTNPVVTRTTRHPWLVLGGQAAAAFNTTGIWYWAVRWKDDEGNLSPYSAARELQGESSSLKVQLSFPPQGYIVADSLISNTRFAWKSDIPAPTVFQLAKDPSFSKVVYQQSSKEGTLIGGQWKTGTWYWRVRTLKPDGSLLSETPARMFRVVNPLPSPKLIEPSPGGSFYLRKEDSYTISWASVPNADYYQVGLFSLSGGPGTAVERYFVTTDTTKIKLPLGAYTPGRYRVDLQAFARDKESSTRIIGYRGESEFSFQRIFRLQLSVPGNGEQFKGLTVWRRGVELAWKVPNIPQSSEVLVARDPQFQEIVRNASGATGSMNAGRLGAGSYYWTVKGKLFGFDVSALKTARFTVQPIPPLPAPAHLEPAAGTLFGPTELRSMTVIRFTWKAVRDATRYLFALYHGSDPVPLVQATTLTSPVYSFGEFPRLGRGQYRWTVKAQSIDPDGQLVQDGIIATSSFSIDLPPLVPPALNGKEIFYGR